MTPTSSMNARSPATSPVKSRRLAAQYLITIAVGMGAVGALASLLLALGFQPLPFPQPGRLVEFWEAAPSEAVLAISDPDLTDISHATSAAFISLGGFATDRTWLRDRHGVARIRYDMLTAGAFAALHTKPLIGRGFLPGDRPGSNAGVSPAWISYRFWQRRYGGSPSIIGAEISFAGSATGAANTHLRIAGVLPPAAQIPLGFTSALAPADVWQILPHLTNRHAAGEFGIARLRPGVTIAQAKAVLAAAVQHLGQRYHFDRNKRPMIKGLEAIAQGPARRTMGLLTLGVVFVSLIAFCNIAILAVAEGSRRRQELCTRAALGASPGRLWAQIAREHLGLTTVGLAAGLGLALVLIRLLAQVLPAAGLGAPLQQTPPLSAAVLAGFAAVAVLAALAWSTVLVRTASGSRSLAASLSTGSGPGYAQGDARGGRRWRLILVGLQTALGICLLAAAALAAQIYSKSSNVELGPAPSRTVLLTVRPAAAHDLSPSLWPEFNREIATSLARLPGVRGVGLATFFPPLAYPSRFTKLGDATATDREAAPPDAVSPGYFHALGVPILFGRNLAESDNRTGTETAAVINLAMARRNWPTPQAAVGTVVFFGKSETYRIVGVAGNFTGFWSQRPFPEIFVPEKDSYAQGGTIILRAPTSAADTITSARQALATEPIPAQITASSTMQSRWAATLTRPRARMAGMLLLALLGLALSAQGAYAVASAVVQARRYDLAVRSALGASPRDLLRCTAGGVAAALGAGAAAGAGSSLLLAPLLEHWLGPAPAGASVPVLEGVALIALAAAFACYGPVRSASKVNPAQTLRQS